MIEKLKRIYILCLESYLLRACQKKLNILGFNQDKIINLDSVKNHVIDLNEKHISLVDIEKWFRLKKNKYRLNSNIYRFFQTKKIVEKYIDLNSETIIDFGSGNGVFLEFLKLKGTGVDISKRCVDTMKSKGIEAYYLNELNDEFKEKFDSAFAFEVIEHVENQLEVLNSIYNYIRKGGYLFVSVPYKKKSIVLKKQDIKTASKRIENYHIFELNNKDFKNLLSHTKFQLVDLEQLNPHYLYKNIFIKLIDKFFKADVPRWTIFILRK